VEISADAETLLRGVVLTRHLTKFGFQPTIINRCRNVKTMSNKPTATIIGAGIVGISTAIYLQSYGYRVRIIDPNGAGNETSFGNAGGITLGTVLPVALPGVLLDTIKMQFDPYSPLRIKPSYLPKILPWSLQLIANSRMSKVKALSDALASISSASKSSWDNFIDQLELDDIIQTRGWLKVYSKQSAIDGTKMEIAAMEKHGKSFEVLNRSGIKDLEPNISDAFSFGILQPDSKSIVNHLALFKTLVDAFSAAGGKLIIDKVLGLSKENDEYLMRTADNTYRDTTLVIAAGAWSEKLSRQLGYKFPLDTERGYHVMLPSVANGISRPVMNCDNKFVLAPMTDGIRLTGCVEFAGLNAEPDYRKIRKLIPLAADMLPGLKSEETSCWMGRRPSLPDSIPIIDEAPKHKNLFFGFGHGHLGMTFGPATGKALADLITKNEPDFDLSPFSATRFL